ncbi:hypothetical protein [Absidia glauca]|uniref:Myb-like domain-containing protein n=1 Tax=Absidia glauca TaxID=4829 RepID=A0A168NDW2_ABSGL|nr:hypothetical protein [Absidia glauca]
MSHHSAPYQDNSGNAPSANVSPMVLEFSSAVTLDSSISDNSQQRHYHEHSQHSESQYRQAPTHVRLPSFSSLISGTHDPLIPDCRHLGHAIPPPPSQAECSTLPTGPTQLPSFIAPTPSSYPHRWSTPTDRSLHHAFTPPPASTRPTSQTLHRIASSTLPLNQAYSASPTADHAYLHHNQSRLQHKHASTTNLRMTNAIDASDLTTTTTAAAVTGSPTQPTNKSRRTRKSKFLNQVGTCVLSKSARWPMKKNRDSNSNIEGSGGSSSTGSSSSSSCNSMTSQSYNHHHHHHHHPQYHRRHSQQQDCTTRRLSTTTITSSSGLMPPLSSTPSIPSLAASSSSSSSSTSIAKPRWQEAERLDLLKAIVKEKHLDDMTSFSWDRISLVVGRAKKACKDQWRREILPALLEKLK